MIGPALKYLFIAFCVAILNAHFNKQQHERRYKNTNPELIKHVDSLAVKEIDSLVVTFKR